MPRPRGWRHAFRPEPDADVPTGDAPRLLVLIGAASGDPPWSGPGWQRVTSADLTAGHTRRWAEIVVVAASLADLRAALPWLEFAGRAPRITIVVRATDRPRALQVPSVVIRRTVLAATLERTGEDAGAGVTITVRLAKATRVISVVRAALPPARHHPPAAGLRLGIESATAAPWAAGDPAAGAVTAATRDAEVHPFDAVLASTAPTTAGAVLRIGAAALTLPPVDLAVCSPEGFGPAGPASGILVGGASAWEVRSGRDTVLTAGPTGGLTEAQIAALRPLRFVAVAPGAAGDHLDRLLAQLCCAGVPVHGSGLPPSLDAALGLDLVDRLRAADPDTFADPVAREAWSVGTRRLALSRFGAPFYWRSRARGLGLVATPPPRVSVVLCTRRPDFLAFALAQVARQDWPELEVVLVLHGPGKDAPAVRTALAGFERPLEVVEVPSDVVFGQALNLGLARCTGRLVTKMDDDDWYGPHHLTDLVQAHVHSGAALIGTAGYHVYLEGADTTVRFSRTTETITHRVHGGTTLLATEDLRALGGWRPLPFGEDAELIRMVQAAGAAIYGIHDLGFLYYRGADHTWAPPGGDAKWLAEEYARAPGFCPPPLLDPLAHPGLAGRSA